jgi:transposase-like protein
MTKTEQNRVLAFRLRVLREASAAPRNVAQTCRHFGLSRKGFYKWRARYEAQGEAGLCDRPRALEMKGPAEAGPVCADLQIALCQLCYWLCSVVTVFAKRSLCCAVKLFENWRT